LDLQPKKQNDTQPNWRKRFPDFLLELMHYNSLSCYLNKCNQVEYIMARLATLLFSLFLFFQLKSTTGFAQSSSGTESPRTVRVERNLRAIKTYYSDATAVFEGFMLCQKFTEKQKLLAELNNQVKQIDAFSRDTEYVTHREAALLRAKAHLLYGVALGMVGDRKLAEFEIGVANEPLFAELATDQPSYKDEEIRLGVKNLKLTELERMQHEILRDLATVTVSINPKKRDAIGFDLKLHLLTTAKVIRGEFVPFVLANAEDKLKGLLLKEGQRDFIYLPAGKYEISKPSDNSILSRFEVKDLSQAYAVTLPPNRFPAKLLYLGMGLVALGALGFLLF
jgi:hypothetical protein